MRTGAHLEATSPSRPRIACGLHLRVNLCYSWVTSFCAPLIETMEISGRPTRRGKRFRVAGKVSAAFIGPESHFTANLHDISTNGCMLLLSGDQLEIGTLGRLGIQVGHETLRATAVAKRVVPGLGVGLEFSQMDPHDHELLLRLIMSASAGRPA